MIPKTYYRNHRISFTIAKKRFREITHLELIRNFKANKLTFYLHHKESTPQKTSDFLAYILNLPHQLRGTLTTQERGFIVRYEQVGIERDKDYLEFLYHLMSYIAETYPNVVELGGEAGSYLQQIIAQQKHGLRPVAIELLQDIARQTARQLGSSYPHLLCPTCFVRFNAHKIPISPVESITYYGCRSCSQSQQFFEWAGLITALLDNQLTIKEQQTDEDLQVNWFQHRRMFDFEAVEIVQATDEDVERFAMQVGNDTDPVRRLKYPQLVCQISSNCHLSENTIRILQRLFGEVAIS